MQPVIDILLANPNAAWHQAEPDVITSLVNASVQLTLDYLKHKQSVLLLPSAEVLISPATGPGVDKLDNSAWLLQVLGLVVQILQYSVANQTPMDQEASELQGVASSCSSNSPLKLTDKLVATKDILLCLLECLNQCSTDMQGVQNSAMGLPQEKLPADVKTSAKPTSVEDGILQLLSVVQSNATDLEVLVDGILAYLQTSKEGNMVSLSTSVKHLSAPFLWLLFKVLSSSQAVAQFYEKGKYEHIPASLFFPALSLN